MGQAQPGNSADSGVHAVNGHQREYHAAWLLIALAVPALGWSLETVGSEQVALRWLPEQPLPHLCPSRSVFNFECAGCGLTRSVVYLMHGRWQESLAAHRLGWLVLMLLVVQIPFRVWCLAADKSGPAPWDRAEPVLWLAFSGLLFANWLVGFF